MDQDNAVGDRCPCWCSAATDACNAACADRKPFCTDSKKRDKKYFGAIMTWSLLGAVFGIVGIVLGCMPACCGQMIPQRKVLGIVGICVAAFGMLMPYLGSSMAANSVANPCCKGDLADCCRGADGDIKKILKALGVIVAYTVGFGWLTCILSPTGIALSGAAMCGCCKAKPSDGQGAVAGVVVAQGTTVPPKP